MGNEGAAWASLDEYGCLIEMQRNSIEVRKEKAFLVFDMSKSDWAKNLFAMLFLYLNILLLLYINNISDDKNKQCLVYTPKSYSLLKMAK